MKTDKLYYTDSMLSTFTATVLSCTPAEKGGFIVVLDKTAFFPEGGGQECDTGVIITEGTSGCDVEAHVRSVSEDKDGVISHLCDAELKPGSTVTGKLDFEKRFSNMQHHSGEHIMSGLIKTLFDKDNVGFHLSGGSAVFDIAGTFTDEELALLESKANEAVTRNLEIVTRIVTKEELKDIPCRSKFYDSCEDAASENDSDQTDTNASPASGSRSDTVFNGLSNEKSSENLSGLPTERSARNLLQLPEEIRIVSIGDVDSCACCAPHVRSTGQIGLIKIMNAEHFRGGTRFMVVCGRAALEAMCRLRSDELEIMHMLSAKQGETPAAVKRLADSLTSAKQSLYSKDEQIALMLMQHARTTGSRVLFCADIDQNIARKCVNELVAYDANTCGDSCDPSNESLPVCFFIGTDDTGYRFIIGGGSDARETLAGLKKTLDIKGGGSNLMVNGTTSASREEIEAAVERINAETTDHQGKDSVPEKPDNIITNSNRTQFRQNVRVILASASPRRKELLAKLGVPFEVIVSDTDENIKCPDPCSLVKELALLKARDVFEKVSGCSSDCPSSGTAKGAGNTSTLLVIGADTVVDLGGTVLGKPKDKADAERMLRGLSGNAHQVHTGIAVIVRDVSGTVTEFSDTETSTVHVDTLTEEEISSYIATGEPFDKAGSYAIQGAFAPYISSIEGDYYNIVGLPIHKLYSIIKPHISL
ncbi:MAG: septum formation protein Maf [Lachnospiraceae bacterium]|nr:septum formation protein Maf [Lachnospiraceae bacterium]